MFRRPFDTDSERSPRPQKQNPGAGLRRASGSVSHPEMTQVSGLVSAPTSLGSISAPASIFRKETSICPRSEDSDHQPLSSQPDTGTLHDEPAARLARPEEPSSAGPDGPAARHPRSRPRFPAPAQPLRTFSIYFNVAFENDDKSYKYYSLTRPNSSIFLQEAHGINIRNCDRNPLN